MHRTLPIHLVTMALVFTLIHGIVLFGQEAADEQEPAGWLTGQAAESGEVALPLKETSVNLEITTNLVYATVRQVFVNDSSYNLEAKYSFPLPSKAVVTDMTLRLDNRLIQSVVKERREAVRTYVAAREQGQRAALLEQERPNLFTTSVANFQPGETVEIVFSYLEPMDFTGKVYEVVFPTTFGPRYFSDQGKDAEAPQASGDLASRQRLRPETRDFTDHFLDLEARIQGLPISTIDSPTHDIWVEETEPEIYSVSFTSGTVLPDRDLVLRLHLREELDPRPVFLQSRGKTGTHGLLTIYPPLADTLSVPTVPREVLFLIDTSGSMSGLPMEQAREGLKRCLAMLNPGDRFDIVRFSNNFSSFQPESLEVTPQNLASANTYIDRLVSNGGTEMQQALRHVLTLPRKEGWMRVIMFLTDGDVGDEDALLRLVDQHLDEARIFAFGVGSAPNEFLLRKLSEHGFGVSTFIRTGDDIGEVMADFFETIDAPLLTDVEVTWWDEMDHKLEPGSVYPTVVPDLFLGRPLQLCYAYDDAFKGRIEVRGRLNGEWKTYTYFADSGRSASFPGIDRLYGQALINDRMVDWIHATTEEDKEQVKREIVDAALSYQLVTRFTSRVAVERKIREAAGDLMSVAVPVMARYGTGETAYFAATATQDHARLFVAALFLALGIGLSVKKKRNVKAI